MKGWFFIGREVGVWARIVCSWACFADLDIGSLFPISMHFHAHPYISRAYAAPARGLFQNRHQHGPLTHLVILVQPLAGSNQTYVVDVGYGGSGGIRPLLLTDMSESDAHWVWGTFPPERHRVVRAAHPASSLGWSSSTSLLSCH